MHAARVLSLKRKHQLEHRRRSRLQSGLPNGDLSLSEDSSSPWYVDKWDERRRAFKSAKNSRGFSLFHMFTIIAFLGVGFMLASIFVSSVPGLLEIGVTAFLFSLFCLIFVRCDDKSVEHELANDEPMDDIIIETHEDDPNKQTDSITDYQQSATELDETQRDQIKMYLMRSNPRKIPSPIRGYDQIHHFSPIAEVSEPSSLASSYLIRSYEISKLAKSGTIDSLSKSNRGTGTGTGGSPINEEDIEEDPLSNYSNSASFDTDDSITADLSVMTVIERKAFTNKSSSDGDGVRDGGEEGIANKNNNSATPTIPDEDNEVLLLELEEPSNYGDPTTNT